MSSRDRILAAVAKNQPETVLLPEGFNKPGIDVDIAEKFTTVAAGVGGKVYKIDSFEDVKQIIAKLFPPSARIISTLPELAGLAEVGGFEDADPHCFANVDLSIIRAHFGVAENSALWVTDDLLPHRVVPFINQHLAIIISMNDIVATMNQAYSRIGEQNYCFGVFIAGPSKTADIEQSLVLGAHGPRSLIIFLLNNS